MTTSTRPGFTAEMQHGYKTTMRCWGAHHRDAATIGTCDGCGAYVAKTDKGRIVPASPGRHLSWVYTCWAPDHECDPEQAAAHATIVEQKLEAGEMVKGQTVEVVRGRKVPKGTVGTIFWTGEDGYGNERIGIKTEAGETFFFAAKNAEVKS